MVGCIELSRYQLHIQIGENKFKDTRAAAATETHILPSPVFISHRFNIIRSFFSPDNFVCEEKTGGDNEKERKDPKIDKRSHTHLKLTR
ncbi:hypothetical protein V6N13_144633 [Hibiscus sabdariffa]|uniref:Uncharacterized protein n=2 Tax=Hibiscus sabdariffa TaxID=183260 RepID=A0ABR1ZK46_9ROSI